MYAYTAIILEPRKHAALEFVLRNFLDNLQPTWAIQIYHGTENELWLKDLLESKFNSPRIFIKNLGVANLETSQAYSKILTTRSFIEEIPTETFLVFQTDSMINPKYKNILEKFMNYHYVGAPWPWVHLKVGNGGLSLRKRSAMLKIIDTLGLYEGPYEDQYYSVGCIRIKANVPNWEEAREFSIEQIYHPYSFGMHKSWLHQPEKIKELCDQCEGLNTLISLQKVL
jgi:hypothetical protein